MPGFAFKRAMTRGFFGCWWILGCVLFFAACGKTPEPEVDAPALNELGNSLQAAADRQLGTAATLADETWVIDTKEDAASTKFEAIVTDAFITVGMVALRESPTESGVPVTWWIHTDAASANNLRDALTKAGLPIELKRREAPASAVLVLKVELHNAPTVMP